MIQYTIIIFNKINFRPKYTCNIIDINIFTFISASLILVLLLSIIGLLLSFSKTLIMVRRLSSSVVKKSLVNHTEDPFFPIIKILFYRFLLSYKDLFYKKIPNGIATKSSPNSMTISPL